MNLLWPPPLPHETYSSSSQSDVSHLETQEEHHAQAQSAVDGTILALGIKALALLHDAGGLLLMAFLFVRRLIASVSIPSSWADNFIGFVLDRFPSHLVAAAS